MRQRAIDWLNSKQRDPESGIKILEDAGYKPNVMEIFRKNINRQDIPAKVVQEIRNYLRYYATPDAEIHMDVTAELTEEAVVSMQAEITDEYPAEVKQVIEELSAVYKQRAVFHNKLVEVGEGNTTEQKSERVKLLAIIKACSDRIAVLGAAYDKFKSEAILPEPEVLTVVFDPDKVVVTEIGTLPNPDSEKRFELGGTLEELKKQSENWRTKISKAENRLLYQDEKKLDKENPMPEGPKRVKQINRIAQLKDEKNQIDMAIANWK